MFVLVLFFKYVCVSESGHGGRLNPHRGIDDPNRRHHSPFFVSFSTDLDAVPGAGPEDGGALVLGLREEVGLCFN